MQTTFDLFVDEEQTSDIDDDGKLLFIKFFDVESKKLQLIDR